MKGRGNGGNSSDNTPVGFEPRGCAVVKTIETIDTEVAYTSADIVEVEFAYYRQDGEVAAYFRGKATVCVSCDLTDGIDVSLRADDYREIESLIDDPDEQLAVRHRIENTVKKAVKR